MDDDPVFTCTSVCRNWRDKLDVLVEFPIKLVSLVASCMTNLIFSGLDLTGMVHSRDDPRPLYDLFAVSNHFGGMGGGHCQLLIIICAAYHDIAATLFLQIQLMQRTKLIRSGTILMTAMLLNLVKTSWW